MRFKLKIADLIISIDSPKRKIWSRKDALNLFTTVEKGTDVDLCIHDRRPPNLVAEKKVFETGDIWSISKSDGNIIANLHTPVFGQEPYKSAIFSPDFRTIDVYSDSKSFGTGFNLNPLEHPLGQVLMAILLSRSRGLLLHATGIDHQGRGIIFAGDSGTGKSTMARLWKTRKNACILSDDRTIIRKVNGRFFAYGTPWHGDVMEASPKRAPVDKIFFIGHAKKNKVTTKSHVQAATALLTCSFPPLWDHSAMEFTLEFIDELTRKIPCHQLGFLPDENVLDAIEQCQQN